MKTKVLFISMIVLAIGFAAISTNNTESTNLKSNVVSLNLDPQDDDAAAKYPKGAEIYMAKCVACHMATGEGMPGVFPPLKNSDYLLADKKRAVQQVLNGSNEAMVVNGATYTMPMTPQVDTKEEAVAVVNYVLNAWGNDGGTVSLEDVKDIEIVR
jgi:mono/diheme cytochrome c family protein